MKIKVSLTDRTLINDFLYILSVTGVLFSFFSVVIDVSDKYKINVGIGICVLLLVAYFLLWLKANLMSKVEIIIDTSKIIVKTGDLFEERGLKVVSFNEYFDTIVDDSIISKKSINGLYITNHIEDVTYLDELIKLDERLKDNVLNQNLERLRGKKDIHRLGSIVKNGDYLLTAFSKFDKDNRAYLFMNDYINFLLNFWNEIDIIYSGESVYIPLLGSGITRFKEYVNISDQELLELLIWSFKISRIKFPYPAKVTFIIHDKKKDKINFYKLKGLHT